MILDGLSTLAALVMAGVSVYSVRKALGRIQRAEDRMDGLQHDNESNRAKIDLHGLGLSTVANLRDKLNRTVDRVSDLEIERTPSDPVLTPGEREAFRNTPRCPFCGWWHTAKCPKVKEIVYRPSGEVERVKFWPMSEWINSDMIVTDDDVFLGEDDKKLDTLDDFGTDIIEVAPTQVLTA